MLKSRAFRRILGAAALFSLVCVPAAAMISSDEALIGLSGPVMLGEHHFLAEAGTLAKIEVTCNPGDPLVVFLIALDDAGLPDYSQTLQLYLGQPATGRVEMVLPVPKGIEGRSFSLRAGALSAAGKLYWAPEVTVDVGGAIVLHPQRPNLVNASVLADE